MTALGLDVRVHANAQLRTYVALLPLSVHALDAEIEREAASNPWLEIVDRPLAGYADDALRALASAPSLVATLEAQVAAGAATPEVKRAAIWVIGALDEHGYLRDDDTTVARLAKVSVDAAIRGREFVQQLEPCGVAARSIGERFRLQLAARDDAPQLGLARALTAELDALATEGAAIFAAARGIEDAALRGALDELRRCDPDPTRAFAPPVARVTPELSFFREGERIGVRVESRWWPEVRLATFDVRDGLSKPMRDARKRAALTIDALARRHTTLDRLGIAIVAHQHAYLAGTGDRRDLLPLSGRDLAREVGCSESTISRAIAGRYASTPFGTVPLRSFVVRRLGNVDVSTDAVHGMLRKLLADAPHLSDQALARTLRYRGIRLARRTVAKYRHALAIPSLRARPR